jgi:hypothetical protein
MGLTASTFAAFSVYPTVSFNTLLNGAVMPNTVAEFTLCVVIRIKQVTSIWWGNCMTKRKRRYQERYWLASLFINVQQTL